MKKWLKRALLASGLGLIVSILASEYYLALIAAYVTVVLGVGLLLTEE